MARLPGGRGYQVGPQAAITQNQFDSLHRAIQELKSQAIVPIGGIIPANLTAAEVLYYFDSSGLGKINLRWNGWAICNGSNSTPNLNGKFPRLNITAAGTTGGNDSSAHTHAIDHDHPAVTSGAESGHTHDINHDHASFTSGAESAHTHSVTSNVTSAANTGSESLHTHSVTSNVTSAANTGSHALSVAELPSHQHGTLDPAGGTVQSMGAASGSSWFVDSYGSVANGSKNTAFTGSGSGHTHTSPALTNNAVTSGGGTSHSHTSPALTNNAVTSAGGSSHTHAVDVPALGVTASGASSGHTHSVDVAAFTGTSGAASATDNRPAYTELVPVMRVA